MYDNIVEWFRILGQPPDRLGVAGKGFSGEARTFSRINSQLQKKGFDHVESFSLTTLTPGGTIPVCEWSVTAEIASYFSYSLFAARSSLLTSFDQSMLPLAQKAIKELKPNYGIGYRRDIQQGPVFYALGVLQGLPFSEDEEEGFRIARWGNAMKDELYRKGILRGVYPWNFLTKSQLKRKVENKSLDKWIQSDPERGTLSPFAGDMSLWELDEKQIAHVRPVMKEAGLLFEYRVYM